MNANWFVFTLYEDSAARERAMQFCDSLVQRFWPKFSFELGWCPWSDLDHPLKAREASKNACKAELIIVAAAHNSLPDEVGRWIELALVNRGDREGALVGLPVSEPGMSPEAATTQVYLRKLAHQSGLDYYAAVPQSLRQEVPESLDWYNLRATQVTSVLDTILHQSSLSHRML